MLIGSYYCSKKYIYFFLNVYKKFVFYIIICKICLNIISSTKHIDKKFIGQHNNSKSIMGRNFVVRHRQLPMGHVEY